LQITVRLDVKRIIAEGDDAAVFFELQTKAPAEATVLVAEWHQLTDGKIATNLYVVESLKNGGVQLTSGEKFDSYSVLAAR